MNVGVLSFGIGLQVGRFGWPVGVLPDDECFIKGVEALATERGGADGQGFLVAFGVCEVQGQGVGDPALFFERLDYFVDEIVGLGFILVGQD